MILKMKRMGLFIMMLALLSACGLDTADLPADGLTNSLGSESVVMSDGSTMIQNYYEGTVATGGLFTAVSNVVSCWVVFEPNGEAATVFAQLKPEDDGSFPMGKDGVPFFVGGGSITKLATEPKMPNSAFRASCEGKVELTAVPIQLTDGPILWLSSIDFSNAVWKAPAGTELSEFFSENGHRSILLMTTDREVDIPETAVAKAYDLSPNDLNAYDLNPNDLSAYDLNPNDLTIKDERCAGALMTSGADIGPIVQGIMFETLIGTSNMLVLGDGNTLGNMQAQNLMPFACEDSSKIQSRSADLGGEMPYKIIQLRYPEIRVQTTAKGDIETVADVVVLGIIPSLQSSEK